MPANTPRRLYRYPTGDDVIDVAGDIERLARDVDTDVGSVVGTAIPIGSMMMFGGTVAPVNFLLCLGQAVSRATYSLLFNVLSTRYGAGDGSTTFNVPVMQGRGPMGHYPGGPWAATLGSLVGSANSVVPTHNHGVNIWSGYFDADHSHFVNINSGGQSNSHSHNITVRNDPISGSAGQIGRSNAGGTLVNFLTGGANEDHIHNVQGNTGGASANHRHAINGSSDNAGVSGVNQNLSPSVVVNFIIRAT